MGHARQKAHKKELFKQKMKSKRKEIKKHSQEKRARLVIKNLPFKITEEDLRAHFEKFGKVKEIQLLKREDGKLKGCGFVQYDAVQHAAIARHYTQDKEFLGRKIECDFAIAKDRYLKKLKDEKREQKKVEVKEEEIAAEVKMEVEEEQHVVPPVNENVESDNEDGDSGVSEESDDIGDEEEEMDSQSIVSDKKPRFESNDITEQKTVFVKNLPFEATNEDLKQCMRQFGPVYYALVCMDKLTEHSKGTGFVKFVNKEDADKCLQAGTELKIFDQILDCYPALNRKEVHNKNIDKSKKATKDSRNLYLIKEGVILAGSKAAEGVSAADMAKRLQLEQHKSQMLKNLNMFISKTRLIIHNLPPTWSDSKLRQLFKKHAGPKAVIKEAKVMRDMRKVDSEGVGLSKEYGFVTFETHEHALNALRSLNNNPKIFTPAKRPIVGFSIENKVMVTAKERRLQKSRQKNPLSKDYDATVVEADKAKKVEVKDAPEFSGVSAKPGTKQKMRSRYNLKTQAELHHQNLKTAKKNQKNAKKTLSERKKEFTKQDKQKKGKAKKDNIVDNFSKMVSEYKTKIQNSIANKSGKSKWYE